MALQFHLLVGTMTGNAQMVAEEVQFLLEKAGHAVQVDPMDAVTPEVLAGAAYVIVCTSTYGSGDVPDNARAFYDVLTATPPDLSAVRYTVFGLGDSTYQQTFNFGGKKFDAAFAACGAQRFFEIHLHNASGGTLPEEDCLPWAEKMLESLSTVAA